MALQDLTPQLRTRMNRAERLAGVFVFAAVLLMIVAFGFYLYFTGKRRGWFVNKVPYYCYVADSTGLKEGDPVRLLGRTVGRIVQIEACPSDQWFVDNNYNVMIRFEVQAPYFGYILTDSRVRLLPSDYLGTRYLDETREDN
jgi:ABC-type transporter Mla subunit MlaD